MALANTNGGEAVPALRVTQKDEVKSLRKVRLPDYNGKGYMTIELLSEKHEEFEQYVKISDNGNVAVTLKVPFNHLDACIKKVISKKLMTPLLIPDYEGKLRLLLSLAQNENDLEEDMALFRFSIEDVNQSSIVASQSQLKLAIDKLLEKITNPVK